MSLPVPNLDDRHFQDIVDDAKRMIPQLVPEWTNHNVADPGVALIELFAWMSEQVIYRLNQVPEKLYVEFLNLLGTEPFPAAAARAPITFWLSGLPDGGLTIPAGTEVTTDRGGVVFVTTSSLEVQPPTLVSAFTSVSDSAYVDVMPALAYDRDSVACFPSTPVAAGDALNFGFDVSLANQMLVLEVETAGRGVGVDPEDVPIVWEAWTGEHWVAVDVIEDRTGGLNRSGLLRLVLPALHEALVLAGERAHWLRVRLAHPRDGQSTFTTSPRIAAIAARSRGGTVVAEHAEHVPTEIVGASDGTPGQRFDLARRPVLPRAAGEEVVVVLGEDRETWTEVADFADSSPQDRHVMFDDAAGQLIFGPSVRHPDGSTMQYGAVPAFGAQVTMAGYRTGGGAVGNVAAGSLTALRQDIAYVERVSNLRPAQGGVDPESVDEVKVRGPRTLRTGRRAVTRSDYEQLTLESTPKVARVLCQTPDEVDEDVRVLVVPAVTRESEAYSLDDFALDADLYDTVSQHIDERRTLGARVRILTPFYQGVSVVARVRAAAGRSPAAIKDRVALAIAQHLSPLRGGILGTGWPFGEELSTAELTLLIEGVPGVGGVDEVVLFEYDLRNEQRVGDPVKTIDLEDGALFLSGRTQVVVR